MFPENHFRFLTVNDDRNRATFSFFSSFPKIVQSSLLSKVNYGVLPK